MNAYVDAACCSIKSKLWEPVKLDIWRGKEETLNISALKEYDQDHYLINEEVTHYGATKLILKEKATCKIIERVK